MSLSSFLVMPRFQRSRRSGPLLMTSSMLPRVRSSLLPRREGLRARPFCRRVCTKHAVLLWFLREWTCRLGWAERLRSETRAESEGEAGRCGGRCADEETWWISRVTQGRSRPWVCVVLKALLLAAGGGESVAACTPSAWWIGGRVDSGECVCVDGDEGTSESEAEPLGTERGVDEGMRCDIGVGGVLRR